MAYFPQFSNFKPHVQAKLNARRGKSADGTRDLNTNKLLEVSKLNVWVRLISGVGGGLVMTSNPDYNLFRAAGAGKGIYDGAGGNATIGEDWNGNSVSAGGGNLLRPKPVVTSLEIDEGAGNISRKATISITAFTKEQMEKVCEYFLEPGYTVFVEFGWNTRDSVGGLVTIDANRIAEMQDFKKVNEKRVSSKGDYENYLGYITGGGVSFDDGKWTITTNLTGFTELPFYLQSHRGVEKVDGKPPPPNTFNPSELRWETNPGKKRFKVMFNDLPGERQTDDVKKLENDTIVTDLKNYINFDETIKNQINSKTEGTTFFGWFPLNNEEANTEAGQTEFPAESKIVGNERFIRMDTLMKILTAVSMSGFKLGNKEVKVNFDISDTIIGGFQKIYSLDKSKLFIPNSTTPTFSFKNALAGEAQSADNTTDNSIDGINFPERVSTPSTSDIEKSANNWGYLKNLYVNFEFAKNIIGTKNFAIKDVLYNILNGLSSAVSSYWQFEIIGDSPDKDDMVNLRIVDLNLVSKTDEPQYEFSLSGEDSIFIESSFDMDIGGEMMNQIIGGRLGLINQKDRPIVGIFSGADDKILTDIVATRGTSGTSGSSGTSGTAGSEEKDENDIKLERVSEFLGKTGIYPRVTLLNKSDTELKKGEPIEKLLYIASYNDSTLFDSIKIDADLNRISGNSREYSPLLPIKFSFTIHGISGIQRGDKFKVRGIPKTFYEGGFFQVTSVKHTVDGMMWKTSVEGSFRNQL
jgi:hypothetical protein